jgi:hypothetical protein
MDKKRLLIILAAAGIVILLACITVGTLIAKYLREREVRPTVEVTNLTACDVDPSVLCVVSFGADNVNRMVINLLLPSEDYAAFYIKAQYDETVSVYPCEVVTDLPTHVFCTGARTPLGQPLDLEAYATDGDVLLARGTLIVSAIALPTTVLHTLTPTPTGETLTPGAEGTPTFATFAPTFAPTDLTAPSSSSSSPTPTRTPTRTPTPGGYPNP